MEKKDKVTTCVVEHVNDRWRVTVLRDGKKQNVYWFKTEEGANAFAEAEEWASRQD